MIIAVNIEKHKREVGKIYTSQVSDANGIKHKITYFIKGRATLEEYLEYCKSVNAINPAISNKYEYFEILTD